MQLLVANWSIVQMYYGMSQMYVTSYIGGLNKVLQHSCSQESCLGCRMTSSFTMACMRRVCDLLGNATSIQYYIQIMLCCLLVYIVCVSRMQVTIAHEPFHLQLHRWRKYTFSVGHWHLFGVSQQASRGGLLTCPFMRHLVLYLNWHSRPLSTDIHLINHWSYPYWLMLSMKFQCLQNDSISVTSMILLIPPHIDNQQWGPWKLLLSGSFACYAHYRPTIYSTYLICYVVRSNIVLHLVS